MGKVSENNFAQYVTCQQDITLYIYICLSEILMNISISKYVIP